MPSVHSTARRKGTTTPSARSTSTLSSAAKGVGAFGLMGKVVRQRAGATFQNMAPWSKLIIRGRGSVKRISATRSIRGSARTKNKLEVILLNSLLTRFAKAGLVNWLHFSFENILHLSNLTFPLRHLPTGLFLFLHYFLFDINHKVVVDRVYSRGLSAVFYFDLTYCFRDVGLAATRQATQDHSDLGRSLLSSRRP